MKRPNWREVARITSMVVLPVLTVLGWVYGGWYAGVVYEKLADPHRAAWFFIAYPAVIFGTPVLAAALTFSILRPSIWQTWRNKGKDKA